VIKIHHKVSGHLTKKRFKNNFNFFFKSKIEANVSSTVTITLDFPNIASDDEGNLGFWTIIYNQGFEVEVNHRKYFAFSKYDANNSYCSETQWGWAHDNGVNPSDWSCKSTI
jgi:hypothetical protein